MDRPHELAVFMAVGDGVFLEQPDRNDRTDFAVAVECQMALFAELPAIHDGELLSSLVVGVWHVVELGDQYGMDPVGIGVFEIPFGGASFLLARHGDDKGPREDLDLSWREIVLGCLEVLLGVFNRGVLAPKQQAVILLVDDEKVFPARVLLGVFLVDPGLLGVVHDPAPADEQQDRIFAFLGRAAGWVRLGIKEIEQAIAGRRRSGDGKRQHHCHCVSSLHSCSNP